MFIKIKKKYLIRSENSMIKKIRKMIILQTNILKIQWKVLKNQRVFNHLMKAKIKLVKNNKKLKNMNKRTIRSLQISFFPKFTKIQFNKKKNQLKNGVKSTMLKLIFKIKKIKKSNLKIVIIRHWKVKFYVQKVSLKTVLRFFSYFQNL